MNTIFTVLDSQNRSQGAIDMACYFAGLSHSRLHGFFPEYPEMLEQVYQRFIDPQSLPVLINTRKAAQIKEAEERFAAQCLDKKIAYHLLQSHDNAVDVISHESRYADVVILNETVAFENADTENRQDFMMDLLKHVHCPAIIAPLTFSPIEEIIFAYDGSESSMFAIKQFSYLFPELNDRNIIIVEVNKKGEIVESERLKLWLADHYSTITYEPLQGVVSSRLLEVVMSKPASLLVIGALGRSHFSSFFKPSTAGNIIRMASNPVFITHH